MRFLTPDASQHLDTFRAASGPPLLCLDFDGVLAPIVADPDRAVIHPEAHRVLGSLAGRVGAIAVVTGRPAAQAVELGRLDELGATLTGSGTALLVRGQYGAQRWSAASGAVESAPEPEGLADFERRLPDLLRQADAEAVFVEHKGLAIALHTRRLPDPPAALARLTPVVTSAASDAGLKVEPGKLVLEVRGEGFDKGDAIRSLHDELSPSAVLYAGDDLGDIPAFREVARLRELGTPGLLVVSSSEEEKALLELADVAVDGPEGVLDLLSRLWPGVGE